MTRILLAVTLYVYPGREEAFRYYEQRALTIAARYDCKLLHAARLAEHATGTEYPYEFHLLSLPNAEALSAWQNDEDYHALLRERDGIIAKFQTQSGKECTALFAAEITDH